MKMDQMQRTYPLSLSDWSRYLGPQNQILKKALFSAKIEGETYGLTLLQRKDFPGHCFQVFLHFPSVFDPVLIPKEAFPRFFY